MSPCDIFVRCSCLCPTREKVRRHVFENFKAVDLIELGWEPKCRLAVQLENRNQLVVTRGDVFHNRAWGNGFFVAVYQKPQRRFASYCYSFSMSELGLDEHFEYF